MGIGRITSFILERVIPLVLAVILSWVPTVIGETILNPTNTDVLSEVLAPENSEPEPEPMPEAMPEPTPESTSEPTPESTPPAEGEYGEDGIDTDPEGDEGNEGPGCGYDDCQCNECQCEECGEDCEDCEFCDIDDGDDDSNDDGTGSGDDEPDDMPPPCDHSDCACDECGLTCDECECEKEEPEDLPPCGNPDCMCGEDCECENCGEDCECCIIDDPELLEILGKATIIDFEELPEDVKEQTITFDPETYFDSGSVLDAIPEDIYLPDGLTATVIYEIITILIEGEGDNTEGEGEGKGELKDAFDTFGIGESKDDSKDGSDTNGEIIFEDFTEPEEITLSDPRGDFDWDCEIIYDTIYNIYNAVYEEHYDEIFGDLVFEEGEGFDLLALLETYFEGVDVFTEELPIEYIFTAAVNEERFDISPAPISDDEPASADEAKFSISSVSDDIAPIPPVVHASVEFQPFSTGNMIDLSVIKTANESGTYWTFSLVTGVYTISSTTGIEGFNNVIVTGNNEETGYRVVVAPGATATIHLNSAIIGGLGTGETAFSIGAGAAVTLTLNGDSVLSSGLNAPGMEILGTTATTLTINGSGTLTANGSHGSGGQGYPGINNAGAITLTGGNLTANGGAGYGGSGGEDGSSPVGTITAPIGGAGILSTGSFNITGGFLIANGGAGVGGGGNGDGNLTISGSFTAVGGKGFDGTSSGIEDPLYAACGAGIGGGGSGAGDVTITGGAITATGGWTSSPTSAGSGIGGGDHGAGGDIVIQSGTITASCTYFGSGIGSGHKGTGGGSITIGGGKLIVTGGQYAAAIGAGWYGDTGKISIEGGHITANASSYGNGVGIGGHEDFSFVMDGDVVLYTQSIGIVEPVGPFEYDYSDGLKNGLIFVEIDDFDEDTFESMGIFRLYGTVTPTHDVIIGTYSAGGSTYVTEKLIIENGESLIIDDEPYPTGITLTNNGRIEVRPGGSLYHIGRIINNNYALNGSDPGNTANGIVFYQGSAYARWTVDDFLSPANYPDGDWSNPGNPGYAGPSGPGSPSDPLTTNRLAWFEPSVEILNQSHILNLSSNTVRGYGWRLVGNTFNIRADHHVYVTGSNPARTLNITGGSSSEANIIFGGGYISETNFHCGQCGGSNDEDPSKLIPPVTVPITPPNPFQAAGITLGPGTANLTIHGNLSLSGGITGSGSGTLNIIEGTTGSSLNLGNVGISNAGSIDINNVDITTSGTTSGITGSGSLGTTITGSTVTVGSGGIVANNGPVDITTSTIQATGGIGGSAVTVQTTSSVTNTGSISASTGEVTITSSSVTLSNGSSITSTGEKVIIQTGSTVRSGGISGTEVNITASEVEAASSTGHGIQSTSGSVSITSDSKVVAAATGEGASSGDGIRSAASVTISGTGIANSTVTANSSGGNGIYANASTGQIQITSSKVTATGSGGHGIHTVTTSANPAITIGTSDVTSTGGSGNGISTGGGSSTISITDSPVKATGSVNGILAGTTIISGQAVRASDGVTILAEGASGNGIQGALNMANLPVVFASSTSAGATVTQTGLLIFKGNGSNASIGATTANSKTIWYTTPSFDMPGGVVIPSGYTLTINPTNTLNVDGTLTNNGTILVGAGLTGRGITSPADPYVYGGGKLVVIGTLANNYQTIPERGSTVDFSSGTLSGNSIQGAEVEEIIVHETTSGITVVPKLEYEAATTKEIFATELLALTGQDIEYAFVAHTNPSSISTPPVPASSAWQDSPTFFTTTNPQNGFFYARAKASTGATPIFADGPYTHREPYQATNSWFMFELPEPAWEISPASLTFDPLEYGYDAGERTTLSFTVTNTGNRELHVNGISLGLTGTAAKFEIVSVTINGATSTTVPSPYIFDLPMPTAGVEGSGTFTVAVRPVHNAVGATPPALAVGTHTDTLTLDVNNVGNISALTAGLSFRVTKQAGAPVSTPDPVTKTFNPSTADPKWNATAVGITLSTVALTSPTNDEQGVEYGFSATPPPLPGAPPADFDTYYQNSVTWQDNPEFGSFTADGNALAEYTQYYFFARSTESDNFDAGTPTPATNPVRTLDITAPTGRIDIESNFFDEFLNIITFGLFFKIREPHLAVTIEAKDIGAANNSGISKVEYFYSAIPYSYTNDAAFHTYMDSNGTEASITPSTELSTFFRLPSAGKYFIYARITDGDDNTYILSSDGLVYYDDSTALPTALQRTKKTGVSGSGGDRYDTVVTLNGNVISDVVRLNASGVALPSAQQPVLDTDYTIAESGGYATVTFTPAYLDTLPTTSPTETINFRIVIAPLGETFTAGTNNQAPTNPVISFTILGSNVQPEHFKFSPSSREYSGSAQGVTVERDTSFNWPEHQVGAVTTVRYYIGTTIAPGATPDFVQTISSTGVITGTAPVNAGDYKISVTVGPSDDFNPVPNADFDELELNGIYTITQAPLRVTDASVSARTYDGTDVVTVAPASGANLTAITFSGLKGGNSLTMNTHYTVSGTGGSGTPVYDSPNAGNRRVSGSVSLIATPTVTVGGQSVYNIANNYKLVEFDDTTDTSVATLNFTVPRAPAAANKVIRPKTLNIIDSTGTHANYATSVFSTKPYDGLNRILPIDDVLGGWVAGDWGVPVLNPADFITGEGGDLYIGSIPIVDRTPVFNSIAPANSVRINFGGNFRLEPNAGTIEGNYTIASLTVNGRILEGFRPHEPTPDDPDYGMHYTIAPEDGWITDLADGFYVIAAEDFEVSLTNVADNATWSDQLHTTNETTNGSVTFYVRNKLTGEISIAVTANYKIDLTDPTATVSYTDNSNAPVYGFLNTITFGNADMIFAETLDVVIQAFDVAADGSTPGSGVARIEYARTDTEVSTAAFDTYPWAWSSQDGVTTLSLPPIPAEDTFYLYARITDNAGRVSSIMYDGEIVVEIPPLPPPPPPAPPSTPRPLRSPAPSPTPEPTVAPTNPPKPSPTPSPSPEPEETPAPTPPGVIKPVVREDPETCICSNCQWWHWLILAIVLVVTLTVFIFLIWRRKKRDKDEEEEQRKALEAMKAQSANALDSNPPQQPADAQGGGASEGSGGTGGAPPVSY